ncbi:uncharacterized protein BT62DRAFT_918706 [Guyanagaster necrorhizus]|uniref:Uncharacterized protein n=1 Tax=Guyanagaster necrorhizus TaxID=856835 RepID=A0A9P7VVV5_9AGAR|nr:uncharacterized protein BT62DRAFT_918706 [Guyanagaster necrorhizus MCA 3950]KAG7448303.1 hypothetical protein BT62DRAFT_918706 [Guyanagaster necrorhizus MCA 3950]
MHQSAKRAEASRLLDPSYYSTTHNYQPRVYIDRKGNMHDPDYRHFPVLSSSPSSSSSSNSPLSRRNVRPHWESGYTYESAIPDDDEDLQGDYYDPFTNHGLRRSSSLTRPTTPYYPSSSPVSDFESPFDDLEEKQCSVMKKAFRPRKCREKRRASLDSTVEESYYYAEAPEVVPELEADEEDEEQRHEKEERPAPTCAEAMKRQWQSISLTVSFGVFRARRRMRRVLSG